MFEEQNEDSILSRMLKSVSSKMDKRIGSIIYDALMPVAIEVMLIYVKIRYYVTNTFGHTAIRYWLEKRAAERGIYPEQATKAIVKALFTPANVTVEAGSIFSCEKNNYTLLNKVSDGVYLLECNEPGREGNRNEGQLLPVYFVGSLETANIIEVMLPGEDEEETEKFRKRYLSSFDDHAYGGNILDYKNKVGALQGVGGVKVYPVPRGGGTVDITFTTSENKIPSAELIKLVQEIVDPVPYHQLGVGVAPIGHHVIVRGTTYSTVNLSFTLVLKPGTSINLVKQLIVESLTSYFELLSSEWESNQVVTFDEFSNVGITVRVSRVDNKVLDIEGVVDIINTKINGVHENLTIGLDELPLLGEVVVL